MSTIASTGETDDTAVAGPSIRQQYKAAWERGTQAESLKEAATLYAPNLASGAIMLLVTLIVVALGALVGGEFIAALPSDSPFQSAITAVEENAGTAFEIFGIALLGIPAVAILAYLISRLGPYVNLGGMYGGGFR